MRNSFAVLQRMFRRSENPVIATLYAQCIGQPLLVEPAIGAQLLEAYMRGSVDYVSTADGGRVGKIAIMDISGPLLSRPSPGPSGPGPLSYEQIRAEFDEALEDPSVTAIVLRLDSPGGMANGAFDLTDHIAASRGQKPIHAVVDHMAFSGAY